MYTRTRRYFGSCGCWITLSHILSIVVSAVCASATAALSTACTATSSCFGEAAAALLVGVIRSAAERT
jgi:hypothetical protein